MYEQFDLVGGKTLAKEDTLDGKGECDETVLAERLCASSLSLPTNYVDGKGQLRSAVMSELGCSAQRAESLVDAMEARGLIRFVSREEGLLTIGEWIWNIGPSAD